MNRIRLTRKEKGYTMKALSRAVGCSNPYMHDVEMGHRKPSKETLAKISSFLGVPVNELYSMDEKRLKNENYNS